MRGIRHGHIASSSLETAQVIQSEVVAWRGSVEIRITTAPFVFVDHADVPRFVPAGFLYDGTPFPSWLRYVPLLFALIAWVITHNSVVMILTGAGMAVLIGRTNPHRYPASLALEWFYAHGLRTEGNATFLAMMLRGCSPLARLRALALWMGVVIGGPMAMRVVMERESR
jgi:hypothetical protein